MEKKFNKKEYDIEYNKKHKKPFKVDLNKEEAIELKSFLKEHGISHVEFVRESFKKLKNEFKQKEKK